jgi:SSS family solute:Na+ symporter
VVHAHFGGSAWPLSHLGLDTRASIYVGVVALAVNLVVTLVGTPVLKLLGVRAGTDSTRPEHYIADEGDKLVHHMTYLIDGDVIPNPDPLLITRR